MTRRSGIATIIGIAGLGVLFGVVGCGDSGGGGSTAPGLYVAATSASEGDSGTAVLQFRVWLNGAQATDVTVNLATSAVSAAPGVDYQDAAGPLTIPAGDTEAFFDVNIIGDTTWEPNRDLMLVMTYSGSVPVIADRATGWILDDDPTPAVSIAPASVTEGNWDTADCVFDVTLSNPGYLPVGVDASVLGGTATLGTDVQSETATVTFNPGETSKTFTVPAVGDYDDEPDETFTARLTNITGGGAVAGTLTATGTIVDDDFPTAPIRIGAGVPDQVTAPVETVTFQNGVDSYSGCEAYSVSSLATMPYELDAECDTGGSIAGGGER